MRMLDTDYQAGIAHAMSRAYTLAVEIEKFEGIIMNAFPAYEKFLRPFIEKKPEDTYRTAKYVCSRSRVQKLYRYLLPRQAFSDFFG